MTVASVEHCGAGQGIPNAETNSLICDFGKQVFTSYTRGFCGWIGCLPLKGANFFPWVNLRPPTNFPEEVPSFTVFALVRGQWFFECNS